MIRELVNPKTETYLKIKNIVLNTQSFPWYYYESTVTLDNPNQQKKSFGFYGHSVLMRSDIPNNLPLINSSYYEDCKKMMREILEFNNIKLKGFYRMNFNSTHYIDDNVISDPHVDHLHPHYNMIIYMNKDIDGNTILYKEKYGVDIEEKYIPYYENNLTVENEIFPKEDKIIIFDGNIFHSQKYPSKHKRRVVFVGTFL